MNYRRLSPRRLEAAVDMRPRGNVWRCVTFIFCHKSFSLNTIHYAALRGIYARLYYKALMWNHNTIKHPFRGEQRKAVSNCRHLQTLLMTIRTKVLACVSMKVEHFYSEKIQHPVVYYKVQMCLGCLKKQTNSITNGMKPIRIMHLVKCFLYCNIYRKIVQKQICSVQNRFYGWIIWTPKENF